MCVSVVNGKWLPLLALCVFHSIQQVIKIIITAIVFFVILIVWFCGYRMLQGYMFCKCQSISINVRSKGIDNCCGLYIRVYFRITPIDLIVNYKRRPNRIQLLWLSILLHVRMTLI